MLHLMAPQAETRTQFALKWSLSTPQSNLLPSAFARPMLEIPAVELLPGDVAGFCAVSTLEMGIIIPIPGIAL